MKTSLTIVAIGATLLVACGPSEAEQQAAREKAIQDSIAAAAAAEKTYAIDLGASQVNWKGTMLGVKHHSGSLKFVSGTVMAKAGMVTGGEFVVDMKNYALTDSNYAPDGSKQGTRAMLMGHLMSPDFFAVDSFPTATLKITGVEGNTAMADLTVRGKTNSEKITDIVVTPNEDGSMTASGKLVFNRQKYGVAWSSGSKDAVLSDDIELDVQLMGKAQ